MARNVAATPRSASALWSASAEYFLPTQQSVPTINNRLPDRCRPLAMGIDAGGTRTSRSCWPDAAAAATSADSSLNLQCKPLTIESPARSASLSAETHSAFSAPPEGATPITTLRAPAVAAALKSISGKPRSTAQPGKRYCPMQRSGRQSRKPIAVFASRGLVTSPKNNRCGEGSSVIAVRWLGESRARERSCSPRLRVAPAPPPPIRCGCPRRVQRARWWSPDPSRCWD